MRNTIYDRDALRSGRNRRKQAAESGESPFPRPARFITISVIHFTWESRRRTVRNACTGRAPAACPGWLRLLFKRQLNP